MTLSTPFSLLAMVAICAGANPAAAGGTDNALRADLLVQLAPNVPRPSAEAAAIGDALALRALASLPRPALRVDAAAGPRVAAAEGIHQDRS